MSEMPVYNMVMCVGKGFFSLMAIFISYRVIKCDTSIRSLPPNIVGVDFHVSAMVIIVAIRWM